jgi:hypothetical protein
MLERAQRLSPRDPGMFLWLPGGAIVHLLEKRNDEATRWTEDVLRLYPRHLISLLLRAAADMGAGNTSAARQHVERIRGISPTLDVAFASKMLAFQHSDDKELILSALRAAGLPK